MNALRQPSRCLRIVVGATQYQLWRRCGELRDERRKVSGTGWYPGLWFDGREFLQPQPIAQVDLVPMDHHHAHPFERRGLNLPTDDRLLPTALEVFASRRVNGGVGRIQLRESRTERLGNDCDVVRVESHMRVALRMDVAHGAIHLRWNLQ